MYDADIPEYDFEDEDPDHRWDPHWDRFMRHPLEVDFLTIRLSLKEWRKGLSDDEEQAFFDRLIDDLERGIISIGDAITEAKRFGVRNPAFDGDIWRLKRAIE